MVLPFRYGSVNGSLAPIDGNLAGMVNPPFEPVSLSTQRLRLRPVGAGDGPAYQPTYGSELAMEHLGGAPWTAEQCAENAAANEERWRQQGFASWLVDFVEPDGSVSKNVALLGFGPARPDGTVGFGWIVAPSHWRRGISREATEVALDWFFENFDLQVLTETSHNNIASQKASASMGFKVVSTSGDKYVSAITATEWSALRSAQRTQDLGR